MLCCDPGIGWLVAASLVSAHHYQVGLVAVHLELVSCQVVGHEAELVTELGRQSIQVTITNCIGAIICIHCNTSTFSTLHVVAWCSILIRLSSWAVFLVNCLWEVICEHTIVQWPQY